MRQTKCNLELSKRVFAVLATAAAFASPAWAYVNGGVYHSTLKTHEKRLKHAGWSVRVGYKLPTEFSDNSARALQLSVKQLIGEAIKTFSKEDADKVSLETKRAVARTARQAIEKGLKGKQTNVETGITGSLRYQVGIVSYSSYYETEELGQKQIRGRASGFAAVIALMPRDRAPLAAARLTVFVPEDAEIFFDGEATMQRGRVRHYDTPALEVGKTYAYEVRARWQKDGKTIERSRKVSMTGGDDIEVNFFTSQGVAEKIEE